MEKSILNFHFDYWNPSLNFFSELLQNGMWKLANLRAKDWGKWECFHPRAGFPKTWFCKIIHSVSDNYWVHVRQVKFGIWRCFLMMPIFFFFWGGAFLIKRFWTRILYSKSRPLPPEHSKLLFLCQTTFTLSLSDRFHYIAQNMTSKPQPTWMRRKGLPLDNQMVGGWVVPLSKLITRQHTNGSPHNRGRSCSSRQRLEKRGELDRLL